MRETLMVGGWVLCTAVSVYIIYLPISSFPSYQNYSDPKSTLLSKNNYFLSLLLKLTPRIFSDSSCH